MACDIAVVALERFWSKRALPTRQDEILVASGNDDFPQSTPQRRRVTDTIRTEVVERYAAGMSCRRVAESLRLGRTTVLQILKDAGVEIRPRGRKY